MTVNLSKNYYSFSWISQFDGKNSLFSEHKYTKIPVNTGVLR
ncbi:hypothetical protein [Mesomycoplasma ovipneumoniae]|nr:hypothetical protein [Mesomycoplasma ovipneumoniae]